MHFLSNLSLSNLSLEKRIPLLAGAALVVILVTFTVLNVQAQNDSRNQALQERLVTAQIVASHIDLTLNQALRLLNVTGELLAPGLEKRDLDPSRTILTNARDQLGIFSHRLFVLDRNATVLWSAPDPESPKYGSSLADQPFITQALQSSVPLVSGAECYLSNGTPVVCLAAPIKNDFGDTIGLIGGSIDVADPAIGGFVAAFRLGKTGYAQIIDANGVVLATKPDGTAYQRDDHSDRFAQLIKERTLIVATCHNCHTPAVASEKEPPQKDKEILAFSPVSLVNWGVAIRQSEDEAFAKARDLQSRLLYLIVLTVVVAVVLVWIFSRSITNPLRSMTLAAERIASGDLSRGINFARRDEVGRLSRAFETMRIQLNESLERIRNWNRELEERVRLRTADLERSRKETARLYEELQKKEKVREELLHKIITVQEEERRRIARELHDETSQILTALVVGLETAVNSPSSTAEEVKGRVEALKPLVVDTLDEVHKLILDLRPSSLDDIGLVAALQTYAESRLESIGIKVQFQTDNLDGLDDRLSKQTEAALFRIVQEAMTNIVKHAEADNVVVSIGLQDGEARISIEDDGRGFDVDQVLGTDSDQRGYGLLGITERVSLLEGTFKIRSHPVTGTRIDVSIPLDERHSNNGHDQSSDS